MKIKFIKSASQMSGAPQDHLPEVAIVGRSNAGKSSFVNALGGGARAFVSQSPGKTRLLNFFLVEEEYRLVDMPGYGYASRSHGEREDWQTMIEEYLLHRPNLCGLLLIMDVRRDWQAEEDWFLDHLRQPLILLLNKTDKLNQSELSQRRRYFEEIFCRRAAETPLFFISAFKKKGIKEVTGYIYQQWVKPLVS